MIAKTKGHLSFVEWLLIALLVASVSAVGYRVLTSRPVVVDEPTYIQHQRLTDSRVEII